MEWTIILSILYFTNKKKVYDQQWGFSLIFLNRRIQQSKVVKVILQMGF